MPGNKYLLADKSQLLRKKLEALTTKLSGKLGNGDLQTYEAYVSEIIGILGEFYKSLQDPQLNQELINTVRADDIPDPDRYNTLWQQVVDDLVTVFSELENIENLTLANFNFITTEANRLTARLKAVDSKLGDYILFSLSPTKNLFFFKDSFNDLSKVAVNSPLLNSAECDVNQTEGVVTLPLNRDIQSLILVKQLPIINPNSNGTPGNNQELGVAYNGSLTVLSDNNPDTWFEYEKVVSLVSEDTDPLILDMTINLGTEQIVNHIRVNPNNFGTKTTIQIDDISTSIDGQVYTSIKDDIPIAGFTTQDEENIFSLAPSTSKFAGQGLYTFTPRKVKYIHFVFRQTEPYRITTAAGEKQRYAIGLRDIDIRGWGYQDKGELVSEPFESTREIRKIVLETNQNPTQLSELTGIQYFVSPDNGGSWHEIQPKGFYGKIGQDAVPEVLDFNTGDADAIVTPVPVYSIRLKTVFSRQDDAFEEGSTSLNKKITNRTELHEVPQGSPFEVELEKPPVDGTVTVVDPLFGSRGIPEAQYIVGHANDGLEITRYRLPFKNFPRPMQKSVIAGTPPTYYVEPMTVSGYMHVEIGGEEWTGVTQRISEYSIDFSAVGNYKKFLFNPNTGVLEFGDGLTNTLAPGQRQPISIWFEPERLFPGAEAGAHVAQLDFPTSNNKDDFTIKRYDLIESFSETFPRKAMVIRLEKQNIVDYAGVGTALATDSFNSTPATFVDGSAELQGDTNSWSVDTENGIVYTARPTSALQDISATYTYQPITELGTDEWDWSTTAILRDSVRISDDAFRSITVIDEELPSTSGLRVLDVSQLALVEGTLRVEVVDGTGALVDDDENPFLKEVDYINGIQELGGQFNRTTEAIPNNLTPTGNVASFTLKEHISTLTSEHPIAFTNTTLFVTNVYPATPSASGEYAVDRVSDSGNYRRVQFYTTSVQTSPGKVTYFYASPNFSDNGVYSVDYKLGRIFTQRKINLTGGTRYVYASYQYTDYRAEYKIARLMETSAYEVDITNNVIRIKDNEVLKHLLLPKAGMDSRPPLYLVNYDYVDETREDISDLASRFSPVLKDYVLRILTKGSII